MTDMIIRKLNSKLCETASFNWSTLAPAIAGIARKKEILLESNLLNLKILAAVMTIPALLTPGIKASIWNSPINKIMDNEVKNDNISDTSSNTSSTHLSSDYTSINYDAIKDIVY